MSSTWRFRRFRRRANGRTTRRILGLFAMFRDQRREGAPPVGPSAWNQARHRTDGDSERRAQDRQPADSGSRGCHARVRRARLDAALARVKQANLPILTPGGAPVPLGDDQRAILIRDIDGRPLRSRSGSRRRRARRRHQQHPGHRTVDYRQRHGPHAQGSTATCSASRWASQSRPTTRCGALTGLSKATVRRSHVQAPGSSLSIEFVEFKGVERTPLQMRIQDRGAARLQLRAQHIEDSSMP